MKRRVFTILVFLLLGAIVNVAVAWGCALSVHVSMVDKTFRWSPSEDLTGTQNWLVAGLHRPGASRFIYERSWRGNDDSVQLPAELPHWAAAVLQAKYAAAHPMSMLLDTRGWPMESMYALGNHDKGVVYRGIAFRPNNDWYTENFVLPFGIVWPGFAINTVFYAVILWLLFAAPFALRRWRRIRRGLCPACAYPAGDSPVCTECGKTLVKQKAQTQKGDTT